MHTALLATIVALAATSETLRLTVADTPREALVFAPQVKTPEGAPVVFAFHGHGGNMRNAARSFHLETLWPEAIVVYPQGLLTRSPRDPQGKRPGWQGTPGSDDDRDLKFFDALLDTIKEKWKVDERRIYATGHSNGAVFTYLLWATRHDVLAAIAPSSAPSRTRLALPLPTFHIAGEQDRIAPFALQQATIAEVKRLNACRERGESWADQCTLYASEKDAPLVTLIHPGGHTFVKEAPALMVRFFREHTRQVQAAASK